jgi:hypothetical protein
MPVETERWIELSGLRPSPPFDDSGEPTSGSVEIKTHASRYVTKLRFGHPYRGFEDFAVWKPFDDLTSRFGLDISPDTSLSVVISDQVHPQWGHLSRTVN